MEAIESGGQKLFRQDEMVARQDEATHAPNFDKSNVRHKCLDEILKKQKGGGVLWKQ